MEMEEDSEYQPVRRQFVYVFCPYVRTTYTHELQKIRFGSPVTFIKY